MTLEKEHIVNQMPDITPAAIALSQLHSSLGDPVLGAMSFLNEIMERYPHAISFAPGAPYPGFYDDVDVGRYLDRYMNHLKRTRGLTDGQVRKCLYQYGPSKGEINALLADALRIDLGIDVAATSIVVTVGCQEALVLALRALCATSTDVLAIVNPSFVGIHGAARLLNVKTVAVAESSAGLDWDGIVRTCHAARARGERVRAMYVAPDFSNPSGSRLSLEGRYRLLALAETEDFLLLEDNAYGFTGCPAESLPTLKALDVNGRVLYFGTCAKTCLPGARVGFVVADQPVADDAGRMSLLADHLAALKSMLTVNTSPICQALVGGMLLEHGGSFHQAARAKSAFYQENLSHLLRALERYLGGKQAVRRVTWNVPDGGFFVRVHLPVATDMALLEHCADRFKVLWTPMSPFHLDGSGDHALRLSCSYLTSEQIDEGIQRFAQFVRAVCVSPFPL